MSNCCRGQDGSCFVLISNLQRVRISIAHDTAPMQYHLIPGIALSFILKNVCNRFKYRHSYQSSWHLDCMRIDYMGHAGVENHRQKPWRKNRTEQEICRISLTSSLSSSSRTGSLRFRNLGCSRTSWSGSLHSQSNVSSIRVVEDIL
jgi:hypothetical protein